MLPGFACQWRLIEHDHLGRPIDHGKLPRKRVARTGGVVDDIDLRLVQPGGQ